MTALTTTIVADASTSANPLTQNELHPLGIATRLLQTVVQIYDRIGFYLIYGTFDIGSGLETFYCARGFQTMPLGQGARMDAIIGYPATLEAGPGEQMFARWR